MLGYVVRLGDMVPKNEYVYEAKEKKKIKALAFSCNFYQFIRMRCS
jgi:hypothetical protein